MLNMELGKVEKNGHARTARREEITELDEWDMDFAFNPSSPKVIKIVK